MLNRTAPFTHHPDHTTLQGICRWRDSTGTGLFGPTDSAAFALHTAMIFYSHHVALLAKAIFDDCFFHRMLATNAGESVRTLMLQENHHPYLTGLG
jgi:hypothetical protein